MKKEEGESARISAFWQKYLGSTGTKSLYASTPPGRLGITEEKSCFANKVVLKAFLCYVYHIQKALSFFFFLSSLSISKSCYCHMQDRC